MKPNVIRMAIILAAVTLLPICARAGCGPGERPTYQDIQSVIVKRFALVGHDYPRFTASFDQRYFGPAKRELVLASLDSDRRMPIAGNFTLENSATLAPLQHVLENDRYYELKLTPTNAHLYLDGPEDTIEVTRCSVTTTLGYAVHSFVEHDAQWDALTHVLDDLQRVIYAMPWQRVRAQAHYGDRCSKDSELIGHPFPGVAPDAAHGILNDYPIASGSGASTVQIGDIYTTTGGFAYFVPSANAYQRGLVTSSDNTSLKLGINELFRGPELDPLVIENVAPLLKPGVRPRLLIDVGNGACFSTDWDGSFPKT